MLFITAGVIAALYIYVRKTFFTGSDHLAATESRNHLGNALSPGLEFLIAADILKTAISPSWQHIGQLATIVGIRTVLKFFLTRELKLCEDLKTRKQ